MKKSKNIGIMTLLEKLDEEIVRQVFLHEEQILLGENVLPSIIESCKKIQRNYAFSGYTLGHLEEKINYEIEKIKAKFRGREKSPDFTALIKQNKTLGHD